MAMAISKGILVLLFLVHFQYLLLPMQAHQCQGHDHDHDHQHHHHQHSPVTLEHHNHAHHDHAHHGHRESSSEHEFSRRVLPEEIAEEEELRLMAGEYSPLHYDHDHDHHHHIELSGAGLWLRAMGCSLLVSTASLVCLILLPLFLFQGKPSKVFVDALAAFGAGAMLGDAFLHQLPHALGGSGHKHDHSSHADIHSLGDMHGVEGHGHSHSIEDLSVGLAVLVGIILFFIVEKIVREVEDLSARRGLQLVHGHHHHHHHKRNQQSELSQNPIESESADDKDGTEDSMLIGKNKDVICEEASNPENSGLRKRLKQTEDEIEFKQVGDGKENKKVDETEENEQIPDKKTAVECAGDSNLVLGYLNLFSDGVHNFTDGMALGSAFLLHGTVGGWSRTLFLLAHEIPQEVGDFGILVRSGFTVFKALAFNFLSALVALAGTALALSIGRDPGHSSLIEGFTAGGFIYIAVAGVLPEMHQTRMSVGNTVLQLLSLCLGISVALSISLLE